MRPGTKVMVLGLAAFLVYGYATRPGEPKTLRYEADAQGRLVQVAAERQPLPLLPRLVKPEPGYVLDHRPELGLTEGQASSVRLVSEKWLTAKGRLLMEMNQVQKAARAASESGRTISSHLAEFSTLSREFDALRSQAWERAVGHLDARQTERLKVLLAGEAP